MSTDGGVWERIKSRRWSSACDKSNQYLTQTLSGFYQSKPISHTNTKWAILRKQNKISHKHRMSTAKKWRHHVWWWWCLQQQKSRQASSADEQFKANGHLYMNQYWNKWRTPNPSCNTCTRIQACTHTVHFCESHRVTDRSYSSAASPVPRLGIPLYVLARHQRLV